MTLTATIKESVYLRLLGLSHGLSVGALERHLLRTARVSLLLVAPSGVLIFVAHATEMAVNPAFRLKLTLIALAGLNAAVFHRTPFRSVTAWDRDAPAPAAARAAAVLSLGLWVGIF